MPYQVNSMRSHWHKERFNKLLNLSDWLDLSESLNFTSTLSNHRQKNLKMVRGQNSRKDLESNKRPNKKKKKPYSRKRLIQVNLVKLYLIPTPEKLSLAFYSCLWFCHYFHPVKLITPKNTASENCFGSVAQIALKMVDFSATNMLNGLLNLAGTKSLLCMRILVHNQKPILQPGCCSGSMFLIFRMMVVCLKLRALKQWDRTVKWNWSGKKHLNVLVSQYLKTVLGAMKKWNLSLLLQICAWHNRLEAVSIWYLMLVSTSELPSKRKLLCNSPPRYLLALFFQSLSLFSAMIQRLLSSNQSRRLSRSFRSLLKIH